MKQQAVVISIYCFLSCCLSTTGGDSPFFLPLFLDTLYYSSFSHEQEEIRSSILWDTLARKKERVVGDESMVCAHTDGMGWDGDGDGDTLSPQFPYRSL